MSGTWPRLTLGGRLPSFSLPDYVAVMVAVVLPWSTSATGLLIVIWLVVLVPAIDPVALRKSLSSPVGYLPVLLVILALAGTFWSDVSITNKIYALQPYFKLLSIPLLLAQFSRSGRGHWVLIGFLVSCSSVSALLRIRNLASDRVVETRQPRRSCERSDRSKRRVCNLCLLPALRVHDRMAGSTTCLQCHRPGFS